MINYEDYYEKQSGSGLPVFYGAKQQKGHGLGNVFKSFYRWIAPIFKTHALPLIKDGAQALGTETVRTLANVANDTLDGTKLKESIKNRSKEAIDTLSNRTQLRIQNGQGKRKNNKRKSKSLHKNKKSITKKKRTKQDIFDQL